MISIKLLDQAHGSPIIYIYINYSNILGESLRQFQRPVAYSSYCIYWPEVISKTFYGFAVVYLGLIQTYSIDPFQTGNHYILRFDLQTTHSNLRPTFSQCNHLSLVNLSEENSRANQPKPIGLFSLGFPLLSKLC